MKQSNDAPFPLLHPSKPDGFLGSLSLLVSLAAFLTAALVFFADLRLSAMAGANFTLSCAVLLLCSYAMYFSMADTGSRAAESNASYCAAKEELEELRGRILRQGRLEALAAFCRRTAEKEREDTRCRLLMDAGLSPTAPLPPRAQLSRHQRRVLRRVRSLRSIPLTPEMLLQNRTTPYRRHPLTRPPEQLRRRQSLRSLLPTTLTSVLTVSIVLETVSDPTWATVATGCIKLFALLWVGAKGYRMGYRNIAVDTAEYCRAQSLLLNRFLCESAA